MTAEVMFRDYKTLKHELSILEFQLGRFQGVEESDIIHSMQFSHREGEERVQKSGISDRTAMTAMNFRKVMEWENDEWFDYLLNRYRFVKEEIEFFEHGVSKLSGVLSGVIMDLLNGEMTWDGIASKYHVNRSMIPKYKKTAIKELDTGYELRDRQTETYILS